MKRILSAVIAFMCMTIVLCACSGTQNNDDRTSLPSSDTEKTGGTYEIGETDSDIYNTYIEFGAPEKEDEERAFFEFLCEKEPSTVEIIAEQYENGSLLERKPNVFVTDNDEPYGMVYLFANEKSSSDISIGFLYLDKELKLENLASKDVGSAENTEFNDFEFEEMEGVAKVKYGEEKVLAAAIYGDEKVIDNISLEDIEKDRSVLNDTVYAAVLKLVIEE